MTKEQTDILPDMSQELASMGRGSMQRRIEQLEALVNNIHGLIMNGSLDCREKCQHIRMAIYKDEGK